MILNIVLLLTGVISLLFGIRNKLKFWIAVGGILLCIGIFSVCIDIKMAGTENNTNDINYRIPFLINNFM